MTIEVGSIVRLKSGGPDMTVTMLYAPALARCEWFDKTIPIAVDFPLVCLDETPREGKPFFTAKEAMAMLEDDRSRRLQRGEAA